LPLQELGDATRCDKWGGGGGGAAVNVFNTNKIVYNLALRKEINEYHVLQKEDQNIVHAMDNTICKRKI
jgi:hypothetical protein